MNDDYLKVGDLVKVTQFDGATGVMIKLRYGTIPIFEVVEIDCPVVVYTPQKYLAGIRPPGSSDEPIMAHWERLEKIETYLPAPEMELDEIHRAQELMGNDL